MPTAAQFLARAKTYLGAHESPPGSNRQPFAAIAGHQNGEPWCATFLVAVAKLTGLHLPDMSASTLQMATAFRNSGQWGAGPRVGAFGFVYEPEVGRIGHVFVVAEIVDAATGLVVTFEGNTNGALSRTGGEVASNRRSPSNSQIVGYGYPSYDAAAPAPHPSAAGVPSWYRRILVVEQPGRYLVGDDVRAVQRAVGAPVDGVYGPDTAAAVRRYQAARHLDVDGQVGPATATAIGAAK